MANFVKLSDGSAVNLDSVYRVELRDNSLRLYAGSYVHDVGYDSPEDAQKAYDELTGSGKTAVKR